MIDYIALATQARDRARAADLPVYHLDGRDVRELHDWAAAARGRFVSTLADPGWRRAMRAHCRETGRAIAMRADDRAVVMELRAGRVVTREHPARWTWPR